jgi:phosphoribosylformimino-5-aminoimidazole carboxamide ribotide isomerase
MTILYPAIDLLGGACVRLYQGDYGQAKTYSDDPVAQALAFVAEGAEWIHMVDLDAAKSGLATNSEVIGRVCAAVDVPVQVGGGVRTVEAALALKAVGVSRVVIGTAAMQNPEVVPAVAEHVAVAVGLDARDGEVAINGWTKGSGRQVIDVAAGFADVGVSALVVTDIGVDGTMEGADITGLSELMAESPLPIIASGGVGTLAHLEAIAAVHIDNKRFEGAIVGRALYEGAFTVSQAIDALSGSRNS